MPENTLGSGGKLNNFDFLRLSFAVLVIFSHSYPLGAGSEVTEPFMSMTRGQTTGGSVAVGFFFIMSGYLIAGSFERSRNIREYLAKRVRRIYPAFIASMLTGLAVVLPFSGGVPAGGNPAGKLINVVTSTFMLQEFRYSGAFVKNPNPQVMNGSVWTIKYEFLCYLGVALLGLTGFFLRRRLIAGLFAALVVFSVMFQVQPPDITPSFFYVFFGFPEFWARLMPLYLAGTTAYLYRDKLRFTAAGSIACVVALAGACFIPYAWGAVFPVAGTYLLLWIAFHPAVQLSGTARFGDLSYGTYLYAFPLQQAIVSLRGGAMNPWLLFLTATPLALVCAFASWHLIEKPFLRRGKESALKVTATVFDAGDGTTAAPLLT